MIWAIMALYEDPRNKGGRPTTVSGGMVKTKQTGVDSSSAWALNFQHLDAQVGPKSPKASCQLKSPFELGHFILQHYDSSASARSRDAL